MATKYRLWFTSYVLVLLAALSPCAAQSGPPSITAGGVVNAAKYTADLAPGAMTSVFGTNLAAATTLPNIGTARILPADIAGVSVEITDSAAKTVKAPLYFISPGQINFQMPFGLAPGAVQVRVKTPKGASAPAAALIQPAAPALFTVDGTGSGEPFVLHAADYTIVRAASPALPGEYLVLMATGLGEVSPAAEAGHPGGDNGQWGPLNWTLTKPAVYIGNREVPIGFWGLMPGFAGVYQLNVQVPPDFAPGLYTVEIRAAGYSSQAGLAVYIGRDAPVVASVTVAAAGGTVSGGGMTVSIPAGAFTAPATVSIVKPENFQPGGNARISDVFALRGLPAELNQPVTITIPLRQTPPAGTETLVAMGSGPGVQGTGTEFLDTTIEGNTARVTLPAGTSGSTPAMANPGVTRLASSDPPLHNAQESGPEVSFYVMTFYWRDMSPGGHFMIFYPSGDSSLQAKVAHIGQILEDAYTKIEGLGLSWSIRKRWPMRVVIRPMEGDDQDKWGVAEPSLLGKDYWSLTLNSNKLAGDGVSDSFRATIGHELLHVMQDLYDPRSAYRVAKFPSPWLWYWEAASTWFESVMLGDESYIPGTVSEDNYTFATRHGLEFEPGGQSDVQNHGYGASMFLQYLTKTRSRNTVGDTIKLAADRAIGLLAASRYSPVEAMNSVYGSLGDKWVQFIEKYAEGQVYASEFPPIGLIIAQKAGSYEFKQDSDTGVTFTWDSPNLSARVFQLKFTQAWPDNTKLTLSFDAAGDYVTAFLYRVTAAGWSKAGSFRDSLTLDNAEQLQKDGAQLIVVVADGSGVGKYKSRVATKLRVQKGGDLLALLHKKTKINHKIYGQITCSSGGAGTMAGTLFSKGPISWSGASFRVETQDSDLISPGEPPYDLVITGAVSQDGLRLVSLNYRRYRKYEKTYKDSTGREFYTYDESTEEWNVSNVPLWRDASDIMQGKAIPRYEARGAAGASAVTGYTNVHRFWSGAKEKFKPSDIQETSCSISISAASDGTATDFLN